MKKLKILLSVLAVVLLAVAPVFLIAADKPSPTAEAKTLRAVIHVNFADADQQGRGLTSVKNMLKEVNGKAEIEVVCHAAGIGLVVQGQSKHSDEVAALIKQGVHFVACENTVRAKSIAKGKRDRFQQSCTLCHSPQLALTQPPFLEKQWSEIVHKMVATYGALLDPQDEREVVAYLTAVHGKRLPWDRARRRAHSFLIEESRWPP
jgi:uncharacterized protein